jgi:hypothetical protein
MSLILIAFLRFDLMLAIDAVVVLPQKMILQIFLLHIPPIVDQSDQILVPLHDHHLNVRILHYLVDHLQIVIVLPNAC